MNKEPALMQNIEIKSIPKKHKWSMQHITPWLFLLPSILILGVFLAYPILEAFKWSFLDYKIIADTGEFVGLANFKEIFTDKNFWNALTNTLVFLVIVLPLNVFLPMILAVLVNQQIRGAGTFRVLYYLPVITPMVVAALMWKMLYSQNGIIAVLFLKMGIFDSPTNLLEIGRASCRERV